MLQYQTLSHTFKIFPKDPQINGLAQSPWRIVLTLRAHYQRVASHPAPRTDWSIASAPARSEDIYQRLPVLNQKGGEIGKEALLAKILCYCLRA